MSKLTLNINNTFKFESLPDIISEKSKLGSFELFINYSFDEITNIEESKLSHLFIYLYNVYFDRKIIYCKSNFEKLSQPIKFKLLEIILDNSDYIIHDIGITNLIYEFLSLEDFKFYDLINDLLVSKLKKFNRDMLIFYLSVISNSNTDKLKPSSIFDNNIPVLKLDMFSNCSMNLFQYLLRNFKYWKQEDIKSSELYNIPNSKTLYINSMINYFSSVK